MAYEVLKDNYYTPGLLDPNPLGIRYDPVTGDYQLKTKSSAGYDAGFGLKVFFQNGAWTSDAIKDPKLFVDGNINKPTPLTQQLTVDIKKKVYAAYQSKGGATKNVIVNNSARPQHQNDPVSVNNNSSGTNPGVQNAASASSGGGGGNIFSVFEPGLKTIANLDFKSVNEDDLFGNNPTSNALLKYPRDILDNQQDTLRIQMFSYKAPLGETFLNPNVNTENIFTQGLQRNSALKKQLGTVILPIPGGIQDSNSIGWGDDNMNNLTAAVTAYGLKDLKGLALKQGGVALANLLTQLGGIKLPEGTINQLIAIGGAGGLTNNPLVQTALASLLLKNAGFEVPQEQILARAAGIVPNSNLELLFQGPSLRQFSFNWRMSPRSKEEANNVKRIIRFFKQGSAPRKLNSQSGAGASSLFLGTPNVFKLTYKTADNKSISGLNKFKICALTNMQVVYAPDGQWAAYDEGQPVSLTMTLSFNELEPIYESDYQSTIMAGLDKDNEKVGDNDVGY